MTYSINAYSPFEGFCVCITGRKGRIKLDVLEGICVLGGEHRAYRMGTPMAKPRYDKRYE